MMACMMVVALVAWRVHNIPLGHMMVDKRALVVVVVGHNILVGHKMDGKMASLVGPSWRVHNIPLEHKLVDKRALVVVAVGHNMLEHMLDDKMASLGVEEASLLVHNIPLEHKLEHILASGLASVVEEPSWLVHNILEGHMLVDRLALLVVVVGHNSLFVDIEQGKCI